uniref:Cytochrome b n=1 Tax=Acrobeloides varius TaxID=2020968 RepID=A0A6M4B302_9BILA|nr:cytochrome b [Acrobeloides varius]
MVFIRSLVINLPCSSSLSYWYNLGSFLGISLVMQVISGLFLLLNYNSLESYSSIMYIVIEVNYGWFFKIFHSNNASIIFLNLYLHLYKNIMMFSYRLHKTWNTGLLMMILIMGAGFSGYVLVGSQMSFWAAMVITSLISVMPINGESLMYFVWGGFSINWMTLQLLFVVHFILPFLVLIIMVFHLLFLHNSGSTSVLYVHSGVEKISFFPYFWIKDMVNIIWYLLFIIVLLLYPYSLGEVELFEEANYLNSPVHIVPEWYFLTSYAILRSVPSKSMGVLIMGMSILVLFLYPLSVSYVSVPTIYLSHVWFVYMMMQFYLSYLGFSPISQPYVLLSLLNTFLYFLYHLSMMFLNVVVSYIFKVIS